MPEWYIYLPSKVDPIAFSVGIFDVRWYALMYLLGFGSIWLLSVWRVRRKEINLSLDSIWDILMIVFFGSILGGRLGFALLYGEASRFLDIFSPWDPVTGAWSGWYGMSFFGALIGAMVFGWMAAGWKKVSFFGVADAIAPLLPLGIFFGRIGNFLNGELIGRETSSIFGMMIEGVSRHPSQLYEACLEGLVLFGLLWTIRNKKLFPGSMLAFFGVGYAVIRCMLEFFRQEPIYLGGITQGQTYSILLMVVSASFLWWKGREYGKMKEIL